MSSIKRVAVIGAGPAGAIAVDALAQEGAFDVIRVFERREKVGGCWYVRAWDLAQDPARPHFRYRSHSTLPRREASWKIYNANLLFQGPRPRRQVPSAP